MIPTPTGQVIPTAAGRDLVLERVLPGSIDDAWASITESDRLARWFCTWTGEPRVGATLELTLVAEEGDATFQAEILACEPPTHLAVSTGAWLLESTLTPINSNHTRMRFVHHLNEADKSEEVGPGWEYYLDALIAAMNSNPMPDFNDYWPSLASAYTDGIPGPTPPANHLTTSPDGPSRSASMRRWMRLVLVYGSPGRRFQRMCGLASKPSSVAGQ